MVTDKRDANFLVDGRYSITDLVDIDHLRNLFERFTGATGFTIGFLDHPGLNILIATGWRDICTKFHRNSPVAMGNCTASNRHLLEQLDKPGKLVIEACENGLVDCATPIIVKGKHIASLATGQILLEKPDIERFKKQARIFGINEREYLKALAEIPVVDRTRLKAVTSFLGEMAVVVSEIGYSRVVAEDSSSEQRRAEQRLRKSEGLYRTLVETSHDSVVITGRDGKATFVSPRMLAMFNAATESELVGHSHLEWTEPRDHERAIAGMAGATKGNSPTTSLYHLRRLDGTMFWADVTTTGLKNESGESAGVMSVIRDVTDRQVAEEELRRHNEYLTALHETTIDLISLRDVNQLIERILKRAGSIFGTSAGFMDLLDPKEKSLVPRVALGVLREALRFPAHMGEGVSGRVWASGASVVVEDYDKWPGRMKNFKTGLIKGVIAVPLQSGSGLLGVLGLAHE